MSRSGREAKKNASASVALRLARARARLEKTDAHMAFERSGRPNERANANAVDFARAIRDALDILNDLPEGYWKKRPNEYNALLKLEDL